MLAVSRFMQHLYLHTYKPYNLLFVGSAPNSDKTRLQQVSKIGIFKDDKRCPNAERGWTLTGIFGKSRLFSPLSALLFFSCSLLDQYMGWLKMFSSIVAPISTSTEFRDSA